MSPLSDKMLDLLIECELYGIDSLSDADRTEVLRASPSSALAGIRQIVALIDLEFSERSNFPPISQELRGILVRSANATAAPPIEKRPRNYRELVAWTAAVAAVMVALKSLRTGASERDEVQLLSERVTVLAARADVVRKTWEAVVPAFEGVRGEVVWSQERREGYMVFEGIPANDRTKSQYQLWIIDPTRAREPVDGGVFDIPSSSGPVIIPVKQKLPVDRPRAFIITEEKPGGVVVSAGPYLLRAAIAD